VVKCIGFDSAADIAGGYGSNSGVFAGDDSAPSLDTSVAASGASSLKFTIKSSSANSAGSYFTNFSSDLSVQFGANSEFYVQWRERFSPEFLNNVYPGGGGWKQAIIGSGDQPSTLYASCTALEVVTQNSFLRGFPQMYNSCTGSTSHGAYDPFEQAYGAYDFKMQNGMPAPYCLYSQGQTTPVSYFPPKGNCFGYFPNEWMTFQVKITTGPRVNDEFTNSYVSLWVAREGQPSQLVINWGPYNLSAGSATDNQRYGKVWLLPYDTNTTAVQPVTTANVWYDELIISRNKIPDPASSSSTGSSVTPPPATQLPSTPTNLSAAAPSSSQVNLSWNASTGTTSDPVSGYQVFRNGTQINTSATTSVSDTTVAAGTTYSYTVAAVNSANEVSTQSAAANVTTPASTPSPSPGSSSSLSQLAASLTPGTWGVLNTTGFGGGSILETPAAGSGDSITNYADKAVWNPNTRQFMFMGAPHYQPHKFVIYSADSNTWSTGPLANSCQTTGAGCPSHAYDHNTINPATGEMYFRLVGTSQVYRLPQGASSWIALPLIPMTSFQCCGALAWFPERNQLVFFDGDWGIWAWSPSTNAWTHLAETNGNDNTSLPKLPMASYSNFAHYDPIHNVILFGGTSGSTNYLYKYSSNGTFTRLADGPLPLYISETIFVVDPVSGKFLVFGNNNLYYEYDVSANTWTQRSSSIPPPIWGGGEGPANAVFDTIVAPISTYGVVMFVRYNFSNSQIYIYKH
jgi:hypothetical protein